MIAEIKKCRPTACTFFLIRNKIRDCNQAAPDVYLFLKIFLDEILKQVYRAFNAERGTV